MNSILIYNICFIGMIYARRHIFFILDYFDLIKYIVKLRHKVTN